MNTSLNSRFKMPWLTRRHMLKRTLAKAAALGCVTALGKSAFAQTWTATTVPSTGVITYYRLVSGPTNATSGVQTIANVLRGPWQTPVVDTQLTATFDADGTSTAAIHSSSGVITTNSGNWTLTPPLVPIIFLNPNGRLTMTNTRGIVLLEGDMLLINPDQLLMASAIDSVSPPTADYKSLSKKGL